MIAGYIITGLLMWMLRDSADYGTDSKQDPEKNKTTNANQIGSPVPVVIGRAVVKQPLVSYYGDFDYRPYTEEYGAHTGFDWSGVIAGVLLVIIATIVVPDLVAPKGTTIDAGTKREMIVMAVVQCLMMILMALLMNHELKTTIQKGFFYYLGWQHIICWSGPKVGLKSVWMNVYDSNVKESSQQGVWGGDIAWRESNPNGIVAHIDNDQMFGGPDEGGGFVGDIRVYLGGSQQPKDSWMISQMGQESVQAELRGLTPKYPMYITAVIPKAYIGKQATIPEMWFEIVNYPDNLAVNYHDWLVDRYNNELSEVNNLIAEIEAIEITQRTETQKLQLNYLIQQRQTLIDNGVYHLGKIDDDVNPAEAIYEILTNKNWGCCYDGDRIDITSLLELGITCEKEKLGISMLMNQKSSANEYLNKILAHINGTKFDNPSTGRLSFRLMRNDYDDDKLPIFNTQNCMSMVFTRVDWSETSSTVSAKFTDASNKYLEGTLSVSDIANIKITKTQSEKEIDATYFTTSANARTMAQTALYSAAYPLSSVEIECNRIAYNLVVGDPIIVSWEPYGINKQVFRVASIDYGTLLAGTIKITALEDIFGFDKVDYIFSRGLDWTEPEKLPYDLDRYCYFESPYEMSFSLNTKLNVIASQPSNATVIYNVWRSVDGTFVRTARSSVWGMAGKLAYQLLESYNIDDTTGIEIIHAGVNVEEALDSKIDQIIKFPNTYNNRSGQNLVVLDNEIISYDSIERLNNGNYRLNDIIRGVYDTIPTTHNTESVCYFLDTMLNVTSSGYITNKGSTVTEEIELLSETATVKQDFDPAKVDTITTKRRSEKPSIMANLKYGVDRGELTEYNYNYIDETIFGGDILFTFNPRNKFKTYSILAPTDTDEIQVGGSVNNYVTITANRKTFTLFDMATAVDESESEITKTDMLLKWANICIGLGDNVSIDNVINIGVGTYDTDTELYSFSEYKKRINYTVPRLVGIVGIEPEIEEPEPELEEPDNSEEDINSELEEQVDEQIDNEQDSGEEQSEEGPSEEEGEEPEPEPEPEINIEDLVQEYANSIVSNLGIGVIVPESDYTPQFTVPFNECPLIFVGDFETEEEPFDEYILNQDGKHCKINNVAYRIDGIDGEGNAIIHKVDIDNGYIIRSNFNTNLDNESLGYKYNTIGEDVTYWERYTWY